VWNTIFATAKSRAGSRPTCAAAFTAWVPDFQYPPRLPNIPFDGEGHLGMFRFADGHVDYRSRYVRTQRYKAQAEARTALFGTYRNPYTDDPRVKGLSRGTANTTSSSITAS
jgi:carotenoid cleavage dioxygenase